DQRLAVDHEVHVAQHTEIEGGGRDGDVGIDDVAGLQQNARLSEDFDFICDDRCPADADRLQEVAVGDKGDTLPPWPVARGEVGCDVVVRPQMRPGGSEQFLLDDLRLGKRTTGEYGLLMQYLL